MNLLQNKQDLENNFETTGLWRPQNQLLKSVIMHGIMGSALTLKCLVPFVMPYACKSCKCSIALQELFNQRQCKGRKTIHILDSLCHIQWATRHTQTWDKQSFNYLHLEEYVLRILPRPLIHKPLFQFCLFLVFFLILLMLWSIL